MATESVHMDVCPEYSRVRETELEGVQPRGLGIRTPRAGSVQTLRPGPEQLQPPRPRFYICYGDEMTRRA